MAKFSFKKNSIRVHQNISFEDERIRSISPIHFIQTKGDGYYLLVISIKQNGVRQFFV